jgi:BolA protein
VHIVSPDFAGLAPLKRHRLVYTALGDLMDKGIHALSIDAKAPD